MKREDIEQYLKVIELNPDSKYILCISSSAGIVLEELRRLKLNDQFIDEILLVDGDPSSLISVIPITKK